MDQGRDAEDRDGKHIKEAAPADQMRDCVSRTGSGGGSQRAKGQHPAVGEQDTLFWKPADDRLDTRG